LTNTEAIKNANVPVWGDECDEVSANVHGFWVPDGDFFAYYELHSKRPKRPPASKAS
jgi:hypothetical protein